MKDPARYRAYLTSELSLLDGRRDAARAAYQARAAALDQALQRELSRHNAREQYLRAELSRLAGMTAPVVVSEMRAPMKPPRWGELPGDVDD